MAQLKFYRGLVNSLPTTGVDGSLYITTDEGGIYLGTGTGMKRLGDFVQVDKVASLPAKAHENCLYYCVAENILAKWNGTEWKQVNKQPTTEELKTLLGLGTMAYASEISESNLSAELAEKVNAAADGNHSHSNKGVLDGITSDKVSKWDEIASIDFANTYAPIKTEAEAQANTKAIAAIKDGTTIDSFSDVETGLAGKVNTETGKSLIANTEITRLAAMSDGANKVEASTTNGNIKIDGVETTVYTHPEKHTISDVTGLQDALDGKQAAGNYSVEGHKHVKADITDFAHNHTASEITDLDDTIKGYNYATKGELNSVDAKFASYVTSGAYATDKKATEDALADRYTKTEADGKFAVKGEDAYDDTALAGRVKAIEDDYLKTEDKYDDTALANRVKAIEDDYLTEADKYDDTALTGRVKAIEDDYLKASDKEDLQTQINTIMNNPDAEGAINSINEFTQYVKDHGTIANGMRTDINKNKEDIAAINNESTGILKQAKDYADGLAENYAAADHDHVAADITDFESAVATKVESYGYATTGYADQAEADAIAAAEAKVNALANGQVKTNTEAIATKANAADVYTKTETNELLTWGTF